jgi:hypothetical protein
MIFSFFRQDLLDIQGSGFRVLGSGVQGLEFGKSYRGRGRCYKFLAAQRDAWIRLGTLIFLNIL